MTDWDFIIPVVFLVCIAAAFWLSWDHRQKKARAEIARAIWEDGALIGANVQRQNPQMFRTADVLKAAHAMKNSLKGDRNG